MVRESTPKCCYGQHRTTPQAKCRQCTLERWCREADNPALLRNEMGSYDESYQDDMTREQAEEMRQAQLRKAHGEALRYSRNDLLEVIVYMLDLDPLALELLNAKIKEPDISFSEIARRRRTSRQAVQQALRRKCRENPELARLLNNREYIRKQRKQPTFMEAVCQIRRQMSAMKSKKSASNLTSYRNLNSWNRNFDLSKMNTLKGSVISPSV